MDNANPTVLSAAQLPSRATKRRPTRKGTEARFDEAILAKPAYFLDEADDITPARVIGGEDHDDDFTQEPIDEQEIYDLISTISDPEHPLSLGQLAIVNLPDIYLNPSPSAAISDPGALVRLKVEITPTVAHCSLATVIGLAVRVRLEQALPPNYRVEVKVKEGTQAQDDQVNKQLGDKERVVAALENQDLKNMLNNMLSTCT